MKGDPQSTLLTTRGTLGPSSLSNFGRGKIPLCLPTFVSTPSGNSKVKFRIKTDKVAYKSPEQDPGIERTKGNQLSWAAMQTNFTRSGWGA